MQGSSLKPNRPPFSDEELKRYKERYMWDARRTTEEADSEGYGYDNIQMFRDLEEVERDNERERDIITKLKGFLDEAREENRQLKKLLGNRRRNR